jgi:hypothetical protein
MGNTDGSPHPPSPDGDSDALRAAGDIIKISTGLATGALVFSVGLLPNSTLYTSLTKVCLVASWTLLLFSIGFGVFSQAAIPVLMARRTYDIEDKFFTYPGRIHQILFGLGLLALALALALVLYSKPQRLQVGTAVQATKIAEQYVEKQYRIIQLDKIELIPGPSGQADDAAWYARFEVVPLSLTAPVTAGLRAPHRIDVLIGVKAAGALIVQQ